MLMTQKSMRRD